MSSPAGMVVPDDKPVMGVTREDRPLTALSCFTGILTVAVKQPAMVTGRNDAALSWP